VAVINAVWQQRTVAVASSRTPLPVSGADQMTVKIVNIMNIAEEMGYIN
jgi:hypothetical protein